jgi:DNA-directed RNA polymerase subunit RPC12/RpoP
VVCTECGRAFPLDEVVRLGKGYVCAACKPQALQKLREGVVDSASEEIRKAHIKHEASVKSVGILYYLGGVGVGLMGVAMLILADGSGQSGQAWITALFLLMLSAGQVFTGTGLRRLKPWARVPTGILSGIGLLGFPIGTLINGWILYLVFSKKGSTVFSEQYRRVIAETPHIKYRTSVVVWILLGLLLLLIAIAVLAALIRPIR